MLLPSSPNEFERGRLLLELSTKRGKRIPNEKLPPQPVETMAARRDWVLGKHPKAKVRSLSGEYDGVGMVFGARRTAIDAQYVPMILEEDGYHRVPHPNELMVGDLVVYKTDGGHVEHVGIIVCIKTTIYPPSRDITVLSQWGHLGEYFHDIDDVDPGYGNHREFWTDRT